MAKTAKPKSGLKVVYSASRKLYPYMLPTITSLLEHNKPEKVYVMIEDDHLPYDLPEVCEVINVADKLDKIFPPGAANSNTVLTKMSLIRSCYCSLFPKEDKLLQLDIDTIVCDSLQPIWDMDMTGYYFAACQEYKGQYHPFGEKYYNIGVCLFNLAEMRKDNIEEQMIELLNTKKYMCIEQDAWQEACQGKILDLPPRYNECTMVGTSDNPAIIHFAGYAAWWVKMVMPGHERLKPYKHLFREDLKDVYG